MEWIDYNLWLIPLMPLIGVIIHIFFGRVVGKKAVGFLACSLVFISFLLSVCVFIRLTGLEPEQRNIVNVITQWIHVGSFKVDWAFRADTLSSVMLLVVTGVGFLIHVYSTGYMHDDPRYIRFFAYLNLFTFAMLILVMASNVFLMFIGWEGVGLCSYLLIGFWFENINNAKAGMKAFVTNRVGDFSFLIGAMLLYWTLGNLPGGKFTLDFYEINKLAPMLPSGVAITVCVLLFGGATGKSAQIPLYVWLPDAMAGPTPVSALIHAATMVTAGVYMIARFSGLYLNAPDAMMVVATVGALTALFSATIAVAQNDIKKVLAYSTVSQLGYMFLGVGVGAFQAGIFHLMTHAFFKGLLFLGAGSVIHGMHGEQDMRKMGALKDKMPYTWATFMVAWLAISGVPGLSGFFSKDEILWKAFSSSHGRWWLWLIGFCAAGLTAFYMTRLIVMTFYGEKRWDEHTHPHESPSNMTVPLMVLAVLSLLGGYVGVPTILKGQNYIEHWIAPAVEWRVRGEASAEGEGLAPKIEGVEQAAGQPAAPAGEHEAAKPEESAAIKPPAEPGSEHPVATAAAVIAPHGEEQAAKHGEGQGAEGAEGGSASHAMEAKLMLASIAVALIGISIGWWMYTRRRDIPEKAANAFPTAYKAMLNKYYVDEFYSWAVINNVLRLSWVSGKFDSIVVDGAVNGAGWVTRTVSNVSGWIDNTFVDGSVNTIADVVRGIGARMRLVQTGRVQQYLTFAAAMVALFVVGIVLWPAIEPLVRGFW